ncbi:CPBP family intramembrane glutamic endopeptidase [Devosia sp. SD17-2]|uniref:CPBP family intramembrane glutamic endopeptidase n=1 Tax=Devosia sp. SD17-2 TaxID=2976459 RepID=UPI0023D82125|nr:CPBP family intramembrane glutamic endopeptidase [Devosia sp. SD17-2]WEJ35087.1 CPBP family intramembrane metalloprotease [Devosia sp. SD17-2]
MTRIVVVLFGLALCYFPSYVNPLTRLLGVNIGYEGPSTIILWNWLAVGALLTFVLLVERRSVSSILIKRPNSKDIETVLFYWGIAMAWSWLAMTLLPVEQDPGTASLVALSIPVLLGMIITTAITEEILFRGYPIERINEMTSTTWIGLAVSFAVFLVPHLTFFGPGWLLYHGGGTVMIYALYLRRRNLVACMLLHFLVNVPILIPASGLFT